jgi:hypothetical protein
MRKYIAEHGGYTASLYELDGKWCITPVSPGEQALMNGDKLIGTTPKFEGKATTTSGLLARPGPITIHPLTYDGVLSGDKGCGPFSLYPFVR